jgi:hypothetical protein
MRNIRAVLKSHQMSAHMFVAPGVVSSKFGDIVPFIVRGPNKVHGVDLRASAKGGASRVQDT